MKKRLYSVICILLMGVMLLGDIPVWATESTESITEESEAIEITSLEVPVEKVTLAPSMEMPIYAVTNPVEAEDQILWSSSNEQIAEVRVEEGYTVIKANRVGKTQITVTAGALSKTITVIVGGEFQPVTGVKLSKSTVTMVKGTKQKLTASVQPADADDQRVTWKSSNTAVAKVSGGQVTAVGSGSATITVTTTDGKYTATCKVTVIIPSTAVKLNASSATLGVGETRKLTATMTPSNTTDTVKWKTGNAKVATVTTAGKVTAKGVGTTTITAVTTSGKKATYKVTVKKAPTSISLNASSWTMNIKATKQLTATLSSGSAGKITWSSSNPAVAKVSTAGKITALKAGTTTVKARTYNGKTASCKVTVRPNATNIVLNKSTLRLAKNKTYKLSVTYTPSDSKEALIWSSTNTSVATVSSSGKVTAVGAGSCYISAKTKYSGIKVRCKVTVYAKQIAITFDDGPKRSTTTRLLNELEKRDVHVTFFLIGEQVPACKDLVKRMKEEGHEIGNHSYTHPNLTYCSSSSISSEITKTKNAIKAACGSYPTLFRAPYGSYNSTVLNIAGLPHIFWSVDTRDWDTRNAAAVRRAVVDGAADGEIILMHDIYETTVDGAIAAIDDLKAQGYEFVTVTQLLTRGGKKISSGTTYYGD